MTGTNRKEMRKLLNAYIALMKVAFDNGINMELDTRLKVDKNGRPWFSGRVNMEKTDFTDAAQDGVTYLYFTAYEWRDVDKNWEQVKLVGKFIEDHKK